MKDEPPGTALPDATGDDARRTRGERRPYRAPRLHHLGCVRDLALGRAYGVAEGAGTFRPRPGM